MLGWLAGYKSPNEFQVLIGLEDTVLSNDDLKGFMCSIWNHICISNVAY
jgi:hypothetical protein